MGHVQSIVATVGDQIHPAIGHGYLAWFDLEADPNGACHVPDHYYNEEYDSSCEGVIKVMNLVTREITTMSDTLYEETVPSISDGLVSWFCRIDNLYGLCVSPLYLKNVTFFPKLGYNDYGNNSVTPPAAYSGKVVWYEYHYSEGPPTYYYRIVLADLRTGKKELMIHVEESPYKVVLAGKRLAWATAHWTDIGYSYQLVTHDIETGIQQTVVENQQGVFGLSAFGNLLAWKQSETGETQEDESIVNIYFQDYDGAIVKASSDEALVSANKPVAVAEDLLAWVDYRAGNYQVVVYDMLSGVEGIVSPENSLISANMYLAVSSEMVVWPDFQNGSFDLRMFHF
jgi:hypothetical protein